MNKLNKQILKFLELSKEFAEAPGDYITSSTNFCITATPGTAGYGYVGKIDLFQQANTTKLEIYKNRKEAEIKKAERWEEYLDLQKKLTDYFESLKQLNK